MIDQERFIGELRKAGIKFFVGVPDSFLNGFCSWLTMNMGKDNHIIAANEGNAIAIAAGNYLATGNIPLVYMQNSGMGNAINPLVSLVDKYVYQIPILMLIGWRGGPESGDWAQHKTQGELTPVLLQDMGIPYSILTEEMDMSMEIAKAISWMEKEKRPYALIAGKGVMAGEKINHLDQCYPMSREEAIETVLDILPEDTIYVATTGRATRELFFLREKRGEKHSCDFLNVGSMGHASSVALGLAMGQRNRQVVCLDGDAAAIMHMGAFTMVSREEVPNLLHLILNNGAHESVGGQPSVGFQVNFTQIAEGAGYNTIGQAVTDKEGLQEAVRKLADSGKASFIDVRIHKGIRGDLPSLKISHREVIQEFMQELGSVGRE